MSVYIIAEAGVNHNGDLELAKKLCLAAKKAGADAVKFQTWKTEKIITEDVSQAKYQKENTGKNESQFEMLKRLELPYHAFAEIKRYCEEIEIDFCSTPDEEESLDFLVSLGIPFIKVGSGEIGNIPFLRRIGSKKLPVILSTGMSGLGDVELSIQALREGGAEDITLLHCTTSYPCPYSSVNLNAMKTLHQAFQLPVGYSDHTNGIEVAIAAVASGANIIEKHFTLDRTMEGPDHLASTEPSEFHKMVVAIRNTEVAMGSGLKARAEIEQEVSDLVLKRIVAARRIPKGKKIEQSDITTKRASRGWPAKYWDTMIGKEAKCEYQVDSPVFWE